MTHDVTVLPVAAADRWRPSRAGLVGLWRYWDETFAFHRGRLLLRGANGSGKSMALELLLPFLLDADASPHRLTSAARSRGGLYERVMTGSAEPTRTGYAWAEFVRGGDVFTVGLRLRASSSTRKVDLDFFTTSLAVGPDLHLLDEHRVPLSRKGLVDALGDRGRVHGSAEEHRAAVREVLYSGFGADRYASVIGALLALRREKLSQNLDGDKLSEVLSDALPPLDEHDLTAVAEGFERLDRRKAELAALESELAEVRDLTRRRRAYARAVMASLAADVRSAETRRDDLARSSRQVADELDVAQDEARVAKAQADDAAARLAEVTTELDALHTSEAYRDGATLDDLRRESRRLAELVERDRRGAGRLGDELERARGELDDATEELGTAGDNAAAAADDLHRAGSPLGGEGMIDDAVAAGPDEGEALVSAWVERRRSLVAELRMALTAHAQAVTRRQEADNQVGHDEEAVADRDAAVEVAGAALDAAVDAFCADVGDWASHCEELGPARVAAALPAPPEEPAAVAAAIATLAQSVGEEHAVARRDLAAAADELGAERAVLASERDDLATGRTPVPEPAVWRTQRGDRPGAPLWRLVDLRPEVTRDDADGVEAALLGAGLLDAWVAPDASVTLPEGAADLVLGTGSDGLAVGSLAGVLVPLDGGPLAAAVVAEVLAAVAVVDRVDASAGPEVQVGRDGSFRVGSAVGRGPARRAGFLGAAAQERRRQARVAELDEGMARLDDRLAALDRHVAALDRRVAAVAAELAAAPSSMAVLQTQRDLDAAEARRAEACDRLAASRRRRTGAEEAVRDALRSLTQLGARHHLPTDSARLDAVVTALGTLGRAAGAWGRRAREQLAAERRHRRATDDAGRADAAHRRARAELGTTEDQARAASTRLAALEATVGAEYKAVLDRIDRLGGERDTLDRRSRHLADARPELERRIGKLEAQAEEAEADRQRAESARSAAHRQFVAAVGDDLAVDADIELPAVDGAEHGVTAVLIAARAAAVALERVAGDETAVERAAGRVQEQVHIARTRLGSRVDVALELSDHGWWLLRATTGGLRRSVAALADAVSAELDAGRQELAADEERLFEQTLAGSVRHALADRIRLANSLVEGINRQLGAVRTAAGGVEVRLRWEVDREQPAAVKAARSLLLRDPASLADDERSALQDFVRARVDQARVDLEAAAPWEARLRETLDYRTWHRFVLELAHRDWEGFQPATARRLQRLSTGERSIALHLPMLASIAAHYADEDGGPRTCPRLILLDELFAGVDAANRAQLFGTFVAWDLDAVLTSDHEWCQYATLDGIAIHHLHLATGEEPVTSTRFTWDGRQRTIDPPAA